MEDGHHFDDLGDAIDQDIVGMDNRLAGAGNAAGPIGMGMRGQLVCRVADGIADPPCGCRVTCFDEIDDGLQILQRLRVLDEREHQSCAWRSRMACILAMTSSCGMPGALSASRASILARNHAS